MKFIITIFQDEDGMFIAECPSIPGCISQGKTEQEAERNIQEAIQGLFGSAGRKGDASDSYYSPIVCNV